MGETSAEAEMLGENWDWQREGRAFQTGAAAKAKKVRLCIKLCHWHTVGAQCMCFES